MQISQNNNQILKKTPSSSPPIFSIGLLLQAIHAFIAVNLGQQSKYAGHRMQVNFHDWHETKSKCPNFSKMSIYVQHINSANCHRLIY